MTKTLPTELKNIFFKLFNDADNDFYHGFTYEMQQAALQLICAETNRYNVSEQFLIDYPPDPSFFERCRSATRIRKNLQEYSWESGLYPPLGSNKSPPTERQWKGSEVGKEYLLANPGMNAGTDGVLNNLVDILGKTKKSSTITSIETTVKDKGFVRITNKVTDASEDLYYGVNDCDLTLTSSLWEVLSKLKCRPVYDKTLEERIFGIKVQNTEVIYTKDRAHTIDLCSIICMTTRNKNEILMISSGKRSLPDLDDSISLSP